MYQGRYQSKASVRKRPAHRRKLNKYFLVTLSLVLLLGVAGGATLAYIVAAGGTVENSFISGEVKCSVGDDYAVTNDGNADAYIRTAVVINWENAEGQINGTAPKAGTNYTLSVDETNWELGEDGFYYYKTVVTFDGATEKTTPVVTISNVTGNPEGFELVVEVLAEAIQAEGMGEDIDTAQEAWAAAKTRPTAG